MRLYKTELIYSTGVSGFHIFKLVFCIHNRLHLHAEILSYWKNGVTFSRSDPLRPSQSVLNVSNGRPWNPKLTLKVTSSKFCQAGVKQTHFQNLKKKGKWFFSHSITLKWTSWITLGSSFIFFTFFHAKVATDSLLLSVRIKLGSCWRELW